MMLSIPFPGVVKEVIVPIVDADITVTYSGNGMDSALVGVTCQIPVTFQVAEGELNMDLIRASFVDPNGQIVTPKVRVSFFF